MTRNCDRNAVKAAIASGMPAMHPVRTEIYASRVVPTCDQCGHMLVGHRRIVYRDGIRRELCNACYGQEKHTAPFHPPATPEIDGHPGDVWAAVAGFVAGWIYSHPELYPAWHDHATEQTRDQAAKLVTLYRSPIFFTKAEKRRDWHQDL